MAEFIKMHGPALDGSGEIHESEVHPANVKAFEASGWAVGPIPSDPEPAEEPAPEPDPQSEEEQPAEEPKKKSAKKRRK